MKRTLILLTCVAAVAGLIVAVGMAERPDAEDASNPIHQLGPPTEILTMLDGERAVEEIAEHHHEDVDERAAHHRREAEQRERAHRPPRPEPRAHHLLEAAKLMHAAAEHLQAGGLPELAERLHHEAERIQREGHHQGPQPRLEHAIRELAEQVERLRRDVDRLQGQLKDITEPDRDD